MLWRPSHFIGSFEQLMLLAKQVRIPAGFAHCRALTPFRQAATTAGEDRKTEDNIGMGPGAQGMSVAEWSKKKNSDKGPPVSARFAGSWCPDADLKIQASRVPGVPEGLPAVILQGILTAEECEGLIAAVPTEGPGYLGRNEIFQLYNDRVVKYRYLTHDTGLAERLQARIKAHLPETLDGGRLHGINPAFRFVHHDRGGRQAAHIDGREPVEPEYNQAAGGYVQSRLSLQLYLSSGFRGGKFVILEQSSESPSGYRERYVHTPRAGNAIIFYQERLVPPSAQAYELFHEARDVLEGDKFACRTMVDYVFPDLETAKLSNLKDDLVE